MKNSGTVGEIYDGDVLEFEDLLTNAAHYANSDWEMGFVSDIQQRYQRYGGKTFISEKQLVKLRKIAGEG